ncbi:hypothetical protein LTR67_006735 [Exophiala xenobiotica]
MALGILESSEEHAPGTVFLVDNASNQPSQDAQVSARLKHGTGSSSHVVLVPQPSDDPNDPLNWSPLQKDWVYFNICVGASMLVTVPSGLITSGIFTLTTVFDRSIEDVAALSGYVLLAVGSGAPFVAVMSKKYGKRPQFLLASVLGVVGSIVCLTSGTNYNSFLAGRVVQGVGGAAYESIIFNVIGDLYFVHQRGVCIAIFNIVQASVALIPPIITGVMTTNQGWRWPFIYYLIFICIQLVMAFLFIRETSYRRDPIFDIDMDGENLETLAAIEEKDKDDGGHVEVIPTGSADYTSPAAEARYKKKSWFQHLKIWNGTFEKTNPIKLFVVVFACGINPATVYSIFVAGIIVSFWVGCGFVYPQIYGPPPYSMDSEHIGYLYSGAVIGGTIVCLLATLFYDRAVVALAKRNNGVYEPEMRLWIMIFPLIFGVAGNLGLGYSLTFGTPTAAAACYALVGMAISLASIGAGAYIVDAYRGMTTEIFILSATCKNMLYFMQSKVMNRWISAMSPKDVYAIIAAIVALSVLSTVPMYMYGKRLRIAWARWKVYDRLHLSDVSLD